MRRTLGVAVAVVLAAGLSAAAQQPKKKGKAKDEPNPVNAKVVEFAQKKLGEQVGNGECWTLAHEAVRSAGAKSSPAYRDSPGKGDYVWGTPEYAVEAKDGTATETGSAAKVRPGQIVQFRDAKFAGRRPGGGTYTMTFPHHTAVVQTVSPDGKTVGILHQNHNGKKTVAELTLPLADLQSGWLRVYQPLR